VYTIKEAAIRSGVSIPTLRAWERRYGVVRPLRTESGYRLYDEAAIDRLRVMRDLIADGWGASQAAAHVRDAGAEQALPAPEGISTPATAAGRSRRRQRDLVAAARRIDGADLDALLDEAFASVSFERAMADVVFPALAAIGDAWARGELDVSGEHAASNAVVRRLARQFDAAGRADGQPRAILGLPPGSHHEIGLLAFAVAARRAGVSIIYLGADVPEASWTASLDRTGADLAVVGVPTPRDVPAAERVLATLRVRGRELVAFVGGRGAAGVAPETGVRALPDDLAAAAATLAAAAAGRPRRGSLRRRGPRRRRAVT
jgi:DNA-binding transcriptional MerR regulator